MERTRKVDLEALSPEQFEVVSESLRKKVKEKIETTISELNRYLNVYGLEAVLFVQIVKNGEANLIKEGNREFLTKVVTDREN